MDSGKCLKIKLSNIGPFDKWDSTVKSIGHNPIKIGVFAKNGTGKSTIAKQILSSYDREIFELGKLIKKGNNKGDFIFEIKHNNSSEEKNTLKISHSLNEISSVKKEGDFIYYVFNKEYTKKNISKFEDDIKGFIVGEKKKDETKFEINISKLKKEKSDIFDEVEAKIEASKKILKDLNVRTNTKEFSLLTFENLKNQNEKKNNEIKNFENVKRDYLKFSKIDESVLENEITDVSEHSVNIDDVISNINILLKENIDISKTSDELKQKIDSNRDFISSGIELSKANGFKECPFCESKISSNKSPLSDYISYLENQESILKSKIKISINNVQSIKKEIVSFRNDLLNNTNNLNNALKNFPQFDKILNCPQIQISDDIKYILKILNNKNSDVLYQPKKEEFNEIKNRSNNISDKLFELEKFRNELRNFISKFNKIRTNYKTEITNLRKELILSKLEELYKDTSKDIEKHDAINSEIESLQIKLDDVKERISKEQIVTETFSNLLKVVFHNKFYFAKDESILKSSDDFEIEDADSFLSEGELRIISFLHYLSSAHTFVKNKNDYKNLFLIIDDPVTSVDFQYSYSICTIINNLKSHLNSTSNLNFMVFTHNLEFMELLSSNGIINDRFEMTPQKFIKLNKTFIPYLDHLRDIISVSKNSEEASHTTANSLRYVIEYISKFESPGSKPEDLIDKIKELKECAFIKTFIHNESHGTFKKSESVSKEFVSDGCKSLVRFIESRYPKQLESIKN